MTKQIWYANTSNTWLYVKFIYSQKATKFCKIFTLHLSYVVPVKSKVMISQDFVAFSEYMNFTYIQVFDVFAYQICLVIEV